MAEETKPCGTCKGTGGNDGWTCETCGGEGYIVMNPK